MKNIHGKLLEMLLFLICLILFVNLLPDWVLLTSLSALFIVCVVAMAKSGFFGKF
ncbi:MAG: hypothetical protein FWG30_02605 [Eubacteriaceae bacterium]|nr:hypothetical protein [Eubacteriaceae bacterium]